MRTFVSMRGGAWRALLRTGMSSFMTKSSDLAGLEQAPDSMPESPLGLSMPRGNCLYGQTPPNLLGELLGLSSSSDDFLGDGVNGNDDEEEASSILNANSFSEWSVFNVRRSGIFLSSSVIKYGGMIVWSADRRCDWRRETRSTFLNPGLFKEKKRN